MSSELNKLPEPFGYVSDWFGAPDGLMRFSRTPFPELHNLTHSVCSVFSVPQVLDVQQQAYAAGKAERTAELEGGACLAGLLGLVADIRAACGDKGQRMQPELVDHIRQGFAERDQLRAEVEALRDSVAAKADRIDRLGEMVEELSADALRFRSIDWHWEPERDMGPGGRWWASIWVKEAPRKNTAVAAIDNARTTHKDEG